MKMGPIYVQILFLYTTSYSKYVGALPSSRPKTTGRFDDDVRLYTHNILDENRESRQPSEVNDSGLGVLGLPGSVSVCECEWKWKALVSFLNYQSSAQVIPLLLVSFQRPYHNSHSTRELEGSDLKYHDDYEDHICLHVAIHVTYILHIQLYISFFQGSISLRLPTDLTYMYL